jgi:ornithine cyclodeaminase/alanine dehydrogenase-like protein (mu-crystallin family)
MAGELLYLSRADVEKVGLPMAEIIAAVEAVFREKGEGRVEMPAKIGIHPAPMTSFTPCRRTWPHRTARGSSGLATS